MTSISGYSKLFYKPAKDLGLKQEGTFCLIETERLRIASIDPKKHLDAYIRLFNDIRNMEMFGKAPSSRETTTKRVRYWFNQWKKGNPFSALAIIRKSDDRVIGHILLDSTEKPFTCQLKYVIDYIVQDRMYGQEAATAVINNLARHLFDNRFNLQLGSLRYIEAIAWKKRAISWKNLETLGFEQVYTRCKRGKNARKSYKLDLEKRVITKQETKNLSLTALTITTLLLIVYLGHWAT